MPFNISCGTGTRAKCRQTPSQSGAKQLNRLARPSASTKKTQSRTFSSVNAKTFTCKFSAGPLMRPTCTNDYINISDFALDFFTGGVFYRSLETFCKSKLPVISRFKAFYHLPIKKKNSNFAGARFA